MLSSAFTFLEFEAGIRRTNWPYTCSDCVWGCMQQEWATGEGKTSCDTWQGQKWHLSRWKFRRSLPKANGTTVQNKNSPSSPHFPSFSLSQLPSIGSDTSALEAPFQMINMPSHIHSFPRRNSSLYQAMQKSLHTCSSGCSGWLQSQEILVTGVCPSNQTDSWAPWLKPVHRSAPWGGSQPRPSCFPRGLPLPCWRTAGRECLSLSEPQEAHPSWDVGLDLGISEGLFNIWLCMPDLPVRWRLMEGSVAELSQRLCRNEVSSWAARFLPDL